MANISACQEIIDGYKKAHRKCSADKGWISIKTVV